MFKLAVTFVAAAALVLAQDTATNNVTCITNCATTGLTGTECGAITNVTCICSDTAYQTAVGACITMDCAASLPAAIQIQTTQCGGGNDTSSTAGTGATTGATGATTRPATTSGATTRPATTSGSTTRPAATTTTNSGMHTAGLASGAALALFGAAFSLF